MRRTLTVLFCVLFLIPSLLSQGIEWEQNFGGSGPDLGLSVRLTQDGGYIGAGASNKDYQCIKLTSSGTVKWDSIYGGSAGEIASSIQQTKDGGYILVGQSSSSDGDVSGNHGKDDEWVLKLDSIGQIEWEHNYGGDSADGARSVIQTPDGGYAIAGFSKSSNIDVSGNNGSKDYWILKLDPLGNIEWEKNYGGSQADVAYSIRRTAGGAYIVSGESWSSDKDVSGNNGMSDFWVLKLDTSGNMLWDSSFGGSDAEYKPKVHPTGGGYILAGDARSSDGDLSGNKGKEDIWVVKLDDTGSLQWEKNYGGSDGDIARSVDTTSGGGFVVAGESGSEDGDLSGNNGEYDYWVLKLDGQGNLEWEENYGGSGHDAATSIAQTPDGGYILTGRSYSSDGDVSGNNGNTDAWVVKLDTSTSSTTISKKAAKPTVRLSPNPTHDQLRIELGREVLALELTIRDLAGRTIKSQKLRDVRTLRTPIEGKPGFYFVELETAEGREVVRKVVKE